MRIAIIGANRGIGARLAAEYTAAGHEVITTARNAPASVTLDVTDPTSFGALADALGSAPLDLLVCNAGVYLEKGQDISTGYAAALWAQTFAVNVTGVFLSVQTALPALRAAQTPKIAIISSKMGSQARAPGGSYIYRSSKAAVLNLGRNIAKDVASDGIAVGIYHPGWVRTDMGGSNADVAVEDSAAGLIAEFARLDLDKTGCFRAFDGEDLPL